MLPIDSAIVYNTLLSIIVPICSGKRQVCINCECELCYTNGMHPMNEVERVVVKPSRASDIEGQFSETY